MISQFVNIKNIISFFRIIFLFRSYTYIENDYSYFIIFLLISKHIEYLNYVFFDFKINTLENKNILNDFVNLSTDIYLFSIFLTVNENEIYKIVFFFCMLLSIFSENLRFLGNEKNKILPQKFKFINNLNNFYLINLVNCINILFFIFLIFNSKFDQISENSNNLLIFLSVGFLAKNFINVKNLLTGITIKNFEEKKKKNN